MVSFDHRDSGTLEANWMESARWAQLPRLDLNGVRRLVVIAAHPDDETLGAAGLISRVGSSDVPVTIAVATDGERSHPNSPTHSARDLARIRRTELIHALSSISPNAELRLLGIPDGLLREESARLRRSVEDAVGAGGDGVLLVAPWEGDGHRDHRIVGAVARQVARRTGVRLLEYPIWMWHWAGPDDDSLPWENMFRLDLAETELAAKSDAMSRHRSQIEPLSDAPGDEVLLNTEFQAHFARAFEIFIAAPIERAPAAGGASVTHDAERLPGSLPEQFFDRFYAGKSDPWGFESRWYEERKRAITIACLPRRRVASALEVGCSTGVLTAELASRCDRLLAIDIAAAPLEAARKRLAESPTVEFAKMTTPHEWPDGEYDLIVLSEVGYYWAQDDLETALDKVMHSLADGGHVLACHWRHDVPEYPLSGDVVHAAIATRADVVTLVTHEEDDFILGVFSRPPAVSVAQEEGLA